ncbi:winged helix-turn-helix transcriptional regulator [Sedimentibacter sp. zth1]|uniref:ArsR/SmtB family transcription factor n=1 Tax=Sedimentibacter sp. zth1 TaxID=2816908 RepID=UPI001A936036|nr:winged helix-turn-helix domain-containing protein [Sedimentibacter sp. zth1]QSX04747.1 winged helix-turn-helix transcriptional regulator [Sedimentibacter sp. zth1]
MNEKILVKDLPNWKYEALNAIVEYFQNTEEKVIKYSAKFGLDEVAMTDYFDKYVMYKNAVLDEITPVFNKKYVQLTQFLKNDMYNESSSSDDIVRSLILRFLDVSTKKITDELIDEIFINVFNEGINELDEDDKSVSYDFSKTDDVIRFLNKIGYDDNIKMNVISLSIDRYKFIRMFTEMITEFAPVCEKYFFLIKEDYEKIYTEIKEENIFNTYIKDLLPLQLVYNEIEVYISIFRFNELSIRNFGVNEEKIVSFCGIYLFELTKLTKNLYSDEKIVTDLKALSDITRFKILRSLKRTPKYLQEISKELELTPATISHHINSLLNSEFVNVIVDTNKSKRIYYEVNDKKILSLVEELKKIVEV